MVLVQHTEPSMWKFGPMGKNHKDSAFLQWGTLLLSLCWYVPAFAEDKTPVSFGERAPGSPVSAGAVAGYEVLDRLEQTAKITFRTGVACYILRITNPSSERAASLRAHIENVRRQMEKDAAARNEMIRAAGGRNDPAKDAAQINDTVAELESKLLQQVQTVVRRDYVDGDRIRIESTLAPNDVTLEEIRHRIESKAFDVGHPSIDVWTGRELQQAIKVNVTSSNLAKNQKILII